MPQKNFRENLTFVSEIWEENTLVGKKSQRKINWGKNLAFPAALSGRNSARKKFQRTKHLEDKKF